MIKLDKTFRKTEKYVNSVLEDLVNEYGFNSATLSMTYLNLVDTTRDLLYLNNNYIPITNNEMKLVYEKCIERIFDNYVK